MSDAFSDRGKSFEAKYKMDEELAFKVHARRNKLLGEWLADKFGMTSGEKSDYATAVVMSDLDEPGIEDIIRKVMADITDRAVDVSEQDVRRRLVELEAVAVEQLSSDYPAPLSGDHVKVGD
ncbi:MAG: DUF1476 domain-containing protein [Rhodospirillales bacterium]|nr:DUF1476 domain-containing protein [Rhodospirillales bacterium]